ncbi:MAG: hypothetical protein HC822_23485 [Oscillochloris sp.]|nr:hypothetical protein [Oscillochloris sp.]
MPRSTRPLHAFLVFALLILAACVPLPEESADSSDGPFGTLPPEMSDHLALGNPSGAVADPADPANYLISRPQYALSYHAIAAFPIGSVGM